MTDVDQFAMFETVWLKPISSMSAWCHK